MSRELLLGGERIVFLMETTSEGETVVLGEARHEMTVRVLDGGRMVIRNSQGQRVARAVRVRDRIWVWLNGRHFDFRVPGEDGAADTHRAETDNEVRAPMPGLLVKLLAAEGDAVEQGQVVAIVEAMKMEHSLRAPQAGRVEKISAAVGDTVDAGATIVSIAPES